MKANSFLPMSFFTASILLAGCSDDSKNPLSDPNAAKPDARLYGVWRSREGSDEVAYWHFGAAGGKLSAGIMRSIGILHAKDGHLGSGSESLCFPTMLGSSTYLNMPLLESEECKKIEEKGWQTVEAYLLFKYKVTDDSLELFLMDSDDKRKAIESGKVKGEIKQREKGGTTVRFTDSSENLARFVESEGDKLFVAKAIRFERVK